MFPSFASLHLLPSNGVISISEELDLAYGTTVHWRANCFIPPTNKTGKELVSELARLYLAFGSSSALESVALKATNVLPRLMLQKPHKFSKTNTTQPASRDD